MLYQKSKAKNIMADQREINKTVREAMEVMATIVGRTLGPAGRPILLEREGLSPLITKDGVTVAKSLGAANAGSNIIIDAAKEICLNTAKEAGDGTTTAMVLANAIIKYGQDFIEAHPKYNPQRIISELQESYNLIILPYLRENSVPVKDDDKLRDVARISANGDNEIAVAVVEAVMAAGDDGSVLLEEAQGDQMRVETIDGYVITSGLKELGRLGPAFINDKGNQQVKMDNGVVFLYDGSINDLKVPGIIQDMWEASDDMGSPIIIFAHDFSDVAMDRFVKSVKGGVTVIPIKTPVSGVPNGRSMFLHDMAAYTGGTVYDPTTIENVGDDAAVFGHFTSAKANMYETFISATPDMARIEARLNELKSIMKSAIGEFDKMHLRVAVSKLTGGVSTIWIGGTSELEIREKKARVEDATEAVRSAIAEGVVPGGCTVHLVLANLIDKSSTFKQSWSIMSNALREPFKLLMTNAGEDPEETLNFALNQYLNTDKLPERIYDAQAHAIVDPFAAGIIEPTKVTRVAINNALSVAALLISLGGLVVEPRNSELEQQLELSKSTFREMLGSDAS